MLNSFSGVGRLLEAPETFTGKGNTLHANIILVINEFYKENGELKKKTHLVPCFATGRLAEIIKEFLQKGSQIGVRGSIETYTDKGHVIQVRVKELELLSTPPESRNEMLTA